MVDPVVGGQKMPGFGFKGHRINTENPQQMMLSANFEKKQLTVGSILDCRQYIQYI